MHMLDLQAKLGVVLFFYKICVLVNFYKPQSTFVTDGLRLPKRSHWRSSHSAVTHVRNKNSNIQGRSLNVVKLFSMT